MAATSTNKRVLAIRFDREPLTGYVNPVNFLEDNRLELLAVSGNVLTVPMSELKALCFVRELPTDEVWIPTRHFTARPKTEGLWLRFKFRDRDGMDGVTPNNLLSPESVGFTVMPPDPSFLTQRIFVPRQALVEAQVLGVIGSPLNLPKKKPTAGKPKSPAQIELFES